MPSNKWAMLYMRGLDTNLRFAFDGPRPRLWHRFWYWALLGWRWREEDKKPGEF